MAEESSQEKTEDATPKRREESRDKGQVARSNELSSVAILAAGLGALSIMGPRIMKGLSAFMVNLFINSTSTQLDPISVRSYLIDWGSQYILMVGPVVAFLVAAALIINYAQVGVLFSSKALEPKFNRMSPLKGIKRIFSSRGLVELAKSLFKITMVMYITYLTIMAKSDEFLAFSQMSIAQIFALSGDMIFILGWRITLMLLVMAVLDFAFQRWDYKRGLRMTKQEVKEELKQQEGDPMIRSRVRSLQREMSQRRMMDDVGQADVVVTNPTHIAVALRYDPENMGAPVVVAKGQRLIAQKIKELARAAGVPLVENKPLARALFKVAHIGDPIPDELFRAVAEVLAFVFQLRRRKQA